MAWNVVNVKMSDWEKIRTQFTEEEKAQLNAAYGGEILCPRAIVIEGSKLNSELYAKLQRALGKPGF